MSKKPLEYLVYRDWESSHIPEILEEIYLNKIYEPYLAGKKDLLIVDIGANIGLFSRYAASYASEVIALEPDTDHFEELSEMIKLNKITNITPLKYAISNKNDTGKLYHNPNTTTHSLEIMFNSDDYEDVKLLTIDELMARHKLDHIDLLKLDPEGEEGKIISSDGFIKNASRIKTIVGEWHDWCNMSQAHFANTLTDAGYQFRWIPNMRAAVYTAVYLPEEKKEPGIILPPQL